MELERVVSKKRTVKLVQDAAWYSEQEMRQDLKWSQCPSCNFFPGCRSTHLLGNVLMAQKTIASTLTEERPTSGGPLARASPETACPGRQEEPV